MHVFKSRYPTNKQALGFHSLGGLEAAAAETINNGVRKKKMGHGFSGCLLPSRYVLCRV